MFITNRQQGIAKERVKRHLIFNEEYINIMQARDFRQGNIVLFSGKWHRIESIGEHRVVLNGQPCPPANLVPVVLDGALLVRCGSVVYCDLFEYLEAVFLILAEKERRGMWLQPAV